MFQAFELGPFLIWSRLLFLLLGIWLSAEFFFRLAESANLSLQHVRDHSLWYLLAFVLGGRLTAMLAEYAVFLRDPLRIVMLGDGVFSFLGGAIGIGAVLYAVTRGSRNTFLQWLDALLPATALGMAFSWIGSLLAGDAYGRPTDMPWGIIYDTPSVRYAIPVHPVQLYYAVFYLVLAFLLLVVRKRAVRMGAETLVGITVACIGSFLLEFFRGDFAFSVFVQLPDIIALVLLFVSLGVYAVIETRLSNRAVLAYEACLVGASLVYFLIRFFWLQTETYELRIGQFFAVLALLITVVYVVVERRRHPYF